MPKVDASPTGASEEGGDVVLGTQTACRGAPRPIVRSETRGQSTHQS